MKIYIIKGDNGEEYEDYYEWIESVYLSKDNAEKELRKLKYRARKDFLKKVTWTIRQYRIQEYETKDKPLDSLKGDK